MKASPAARSWIAAGVRHELLTRALPALRHDMAAPVSVIRMALLMLKRQVAAPAVDSAACIERVALVDAQLSELVAAIRSLRDWELSTVADDGITRTALVAQCTGLMRAAFDMQGIGLQVDPALSHEGGGEVETRWPASAALRYLMLGALGHLHDAVEDAGGLVVEPDGTDGVCVRAVSQGDGEATRADIAMHRAPRALGIDAIALQALADDLGYVIAVTADSVRFRLATAV